MIIKKLANNYYVAQQESVYGYGTNFFKALRSCLRQIEEDHREYIKELFKSPLYGGDNYPPGYREYDL